jgi:phage-related minor tail protein
MTEYITGDEAIEVVRRVQTAATQAVQAMEDYVELFAGGEATAEQMGNVYANLQRVQDEVGASTDYLMRVPLPPRKDDPA